MKYPDVFRLKISLTTECNYNCEYCFLHFKDKVKPSLEDFKRYIKIIHNIQIKDRFKKIMFCITGGEPTLVSFFNEFIEFLLVYFKDYEIFFKITTNFTKEYKIYQISKFFNSIKNDKFFIRYLFSYHNEEYKDGFDKFYKKVKKFKNIINKKEAIKIYFMIEDINEYKIVAEKYADSLQKDNIEIMFQYIHGIENYYSDRKIDKKDNISEDIKVSNNKGLMCNAIFNSIFLFPNGDIIPCPNCNVTKAFGNLNKKETIEKISKILEIGGYMCEYNKCFNYSVDFFYQEKLKDFMISKNILKNKFYEKGK